MPLSACVRCATKYKIIEHTRVKVFSIPDIQRSESIIFQGSRDLRYPKKGESARRVLFM